MGPVRIRSLDAGGEASAEGKNGDIQVKALRTGSIRRAKVSTI
jgi:hypothetical protein